MGRFNTSLKDRELRQVNTINSEVRSKLQDLLEDLIGSLDLNEQMLIKELRCFR
jgi:hypothetical protein